VPLIRKRVTCPYCDETIFLGDCPIVATNREEGAGQFSSVAATSPGERYPVLWRKPPETRKVAPPPPPKGIFGRIVEALANIPEEEEPDEYEDVRPVSALGYPWQDLPARACSECGTPLPDEIGDRQVLKIGIVGTTGAGKSHFLAALIKDAAHGQALRKWGIAEFDLVETSSEIYRDKYESFWHDRTVLDPTNPADAPDVVFRPIIVRVTFLRGTRVFLYFYDIDGETLVNRGQRARHASYLRRPHGLIFLIDPMMIDSIRKHLPPDESSESTYKRFIRQGDLVSACIADLEPGRMRQTPIAITLSKSDLVVAAADRNYSFTFSRPSAASDPIEAIAAEMAQISKEVREVFGASGERDLLAVADRLGPTAPVTYHAVAPIGCAPQYEGSERLAPEIKPLRCLDPLIALISPWVREQIKVSS
jgi:hypothetical protein